MDAEQISLSSGTEATVADVTPAPKNTRKRLLAAFASTIVPGIGQWFLGAKRASAIFLTLFCATLLCYWPLALSRYVVGYYLLVLATIVLCTIAPWHAIRVSRIDIARASHWWALLLLPLGFLTASAHTIWEFRAAGCRSFLVPSESMEPTIDRGDHIIVDTRFYHDREPKAGDVVAFRHGEVYLIKRVIAAGGSTIQGRNDVIFVDGKQMIEPYVQHSDHSDPRLKTFGPLRVPKDQLFVMGDNRDLSIDSRMPEFGFVDQTSVLGRPLYIVQSDYHRERIGSTIQ